MRIFMTITMIAVMIFRVSSVLEAQQQVTFKEDFEGKPGKGWKEWNTEGERVEINNGK